VYIRPKCSWIRFEAQLPNQCWQADVTQWRLGDSTEVEICVFLDDYSRLVTAAQMFTVTTAAAVARLFRKGARTWGLPASVLTDNGCVFTPWHRGGATALRSRTARSGYRTQTLPSLPSPNLRQGGTVPSDPSNASSPNNRQPKPSPIYKPRSTGSSPITTSALSIAQNGTTARSLVGNAVASALPTRSDDSPKRRLEQATSLPFAFERTVV
jgi:hypothetical protein